MLTVLSLILSMAQVSGLMIVLFRFSGTTGLDSGMMSFIILVSGLAGVANHFITRKLGTANTFSFLAALSGVGIMGIELGRLCFH